MSKSITSTLSSSFIKAEATRLGFTACGIANARTVEPKVQEAYERWIASGHQAQMAYMNRNLDLRYHPDLLLPGCRTIISLALDYTPTERIAPDHPQIAFYVYGPDYHDVMKARIRELAKAIFKSSEHSDYSEYSESSPSGNFEGGRFRVAVDTAPMLERYWAEKSGIGWIGRHRNLIVPGCGSFVFLGELLLTTDVDQYDSPIPNRCGTCHRCIDACPTGALSQSSESNKLEEASFDARRCLSYLTIEHRGPFTPEQAGIVRNQPTPRYIYGCDRCQLACPHNNRVYKANTPYKPHDTNTPFQASPRLLSMTATDWATLTREQYQELFRGSAVKRAKYEGLMRNIETICPLNESK